MSFRSQTLQCDSCKNFENIKIPESPYINFFSLLRRISSVIMPKTYNPSVLVNYYYVLTFGLLPLGFCYFV